MSGQSGTEKQHRGNNHVSTGTSSKHKIDIGWGLLHQDPGAHCVKIQLRQDTEGWKMLTGNQVVSIVYRNIGEEYGLEIPRLK